MVNVALKNLTKKFDDIIAVDNLNAVIEDKEFMVLLGPSGCGKTTTLRMIAGLEEITAGEISIDNRLVNDVLPKDRDIAMVFQNYALYPHMSVYDNMAFGLKMRKIPRQDIEQRVTEAAKILSIEELLGRKPKQLSGGQKQRVALGRAIVRKPKVFLMDEPLSNLDSKLRVQMRTEIAKLHRRLEATIIYVTHDQTEAMTMATRIIIMKDGVIHQIGAPQDVYRKPKNMFVAGFIGSPAMNFAEVEVTDNYELKCDSFTIEADNQLRNIIQKNYLAGKEVVLGIRPEDLEDITFVPEAQEGSLIHAPVEITEPMGAEVYVYINTNGIRMTARVNPKSGAHPGGKITLHVQREKLHLFDKETEEAYTLTHQV